MDVHLKGGFYKSVDGAQDHLVEPGATATVLLVWARSGMVPGIRVRVTGVKVDGSNANYVSFETEIAVSDMLGDVRDYPA